MADILIGDAREEKAPEATSSWKKLTPEEQAQVQKEVPGAQGLIDVKGPLSSKKGTLQAPPAAPSSSKLAPAPIPRSSLTSSKLHPLVEGQLRQDAAAYGLDSNWLVPLFEAEGGGFDKISSAGAEGPAQLMPATAREVGVDRRNPSENITGGIKYFSELLHTFGGNYPVAVAAYNAGPNNLGVQTFAQTGNPELLPNETKSYLKGILRSHAQLIANRQLVRPGQGQEERFQGQEERLPSSRDLSSSLSSGSSVAQEFFDELDRGAKENADIDTSSGAPFWVRTEFQMARDAKEARKVLEQYYPPGDVGQDTKGHWWVRIGGKRTRVMPTQGFGQFLENLGASLAAESPAIVGSVVGSAGGALMGSEVPFIGSGLGAVYGAATGWTAGWALQQAYKGAIGVGDMTPKDVVEEVPEQMLLGGAGEILGGGWRGLKNWARFGYAEVTPGVTELTNQALAQGAQPPVISYAPSATITQWHQALAEFLSPGKLAKKNYPVIRKMAKDLFKSEGLTDEQIDNFFSLMEQGQTASQTALGQRIVGAARAYEAKLQSLVHKDIEAARKLVLEDLGTIKAWGDTATGRLGEDVAQRFLALRKGVSERFRNVYESLDSAFGGRRVVPMDGVIRKAKELVRLSQFLPPFVRDIAAHGGTNVRMTVARAHQLRSDIRKLLEVPSNVVKDPFWHRLSEIEDAVDDALGSIDDPAASIFKKDLSNADAAYRTAILPFKNATLNKIVRDFQQDGIVPDPGRVAKLLLTSGRTEESKTLLGMLGPEIQQQVGKRYLLELLKSSERSDALGRSSLSGKELAQAVEEARSQLELLFKKEDVNNLLEQARKLAVVDEYSRGNFGDLAHLSPGAVADSLASSRQHAFHLQDFVQNNPTAALLSKTESDMFDTAVDYVIAPGMEERTRRAMDLLVQYDPASWKQVQFLAKYKLYLRSLKRDHLGNLDVDAKSLEDSLHKMTVAQRQMLFPNDGDRDLLHFAEMARFLFPGQLVGGRVGRIGPSLIASGIMKRVGIPWPWRPLTILADLAWAHAMVFGWMLRRPWLTKAVVNASRVMPEKMPTLMRWVYATALADAEAGPGRDREKRDIEVAPREEERPGAYQQRTDMGRQPALALE